MTTITFDTSDMYPIGTQYHSRGKVQRLNTVIGYRVVYDTDTEAMRILYRTSHEFCGQTMVDADVVGTTIAMSHSLLGVPS